MAVIINMAMLESNVPVRNHRRSQHQEAQFERLLADAFRRAGWQVLHRPERRPDDTQADFVVDAGDKKYVVELKRSAEGRRDRLIPLLSQAILMAQAIAKRLSERSVPVAVVAADRIPDSVAKQVQKFGIEHASDVGVGVIDSEGFRAFAGHGLEVLNAKGAGSPHIKLPARSGPSPSLFSDLNQWMLKILLSENIPEPFLSAPRARYKNVSQLAQAAGVSVMSTFRLVRELSSQGFLDERAGWLRIVRIEELMHRWLAANQNSGNDIPLRWIIPGNQDQLSAAIQPYVSEVGKHILRPRNARGRIVRPAPRICMGLFAAADHHGIGFVHGVQPHVYIERLDAEALQTLGLSSENADRNADVFVRVPKNQDALFRASVQRNGLPVADILQVWLDVGNHPVRGKEQAEQIWKRILAPCFRKASR
ncbi:MAG: restriction endonuclease [Acidobacteria bacterium]|nr:restriction endonuclease [Acidobacteriota bacterium]